MELDIKAIKAVAIKELAEEEFRNAVEKYKSELKNKMSLWDTIFPYKVLIIKKEKQNGGR